MIHRNIALLKEFFSDWRNSLAFLTLPILGVWIFSRVSNIKPAILGDEYIYAMNARKAGPWEAPVAGDFSNYLFNFFYQGTNLCGDEFYSCGKVMNIFFFLGFVWILYLVGRRLLPFWVSYFYMAVAALSPLNVYTSLFLPESLYFFLLGLVLLAVLRALQDFNMGNWFWVGAALAIASLAKPHAWLSAIAIAILFTIVGLTDKRVNFRTLFKSLSGFLIGSIATRVLVGLVIAGPKALNFFGQYVNSSTLQELTAVDPGTTAGPSAQTPLDGVASLFVWQSEVHITTIVALMALGIIGIISSIFDLIKTKNLSLANGFALFSCIWLVSLVLEIVVFTGWVTGSGDDHTLRILMRYYDFLIVIVPLSGLASLYQRTAERVHVTARWVIAILLSLPLSSAFTGFFGTLNIQIADAPALAGLVVDLQVFNAVAVASFSSLILFAAFPRFAGIALIALLPLTMVATGWQTQDQYFKARGNYEGFDLAGIAARELIPDDKRESVWILANSRFDATAAALAFDTEFLSYELYAPGSVLTSDYVPADFDFIIATGEIKIEGLEVLTSGAGYMIYRN